MKRKISLLCALLLAIVSIGAFVFVFPAGQSTMPEKQSAQDTAQTQPTEQPESTEQETEPTTESVDDTAPLGTHPMDGIIEKMTREEKVAQMFWVRCPDTGAVELIEQYNPAGYVLFARDFEDKTRDAVAQTVQSYQDAAYVKFSEQAYAVMIDHRTDLIDEMIDEINGKHYYGFALGVILFMVARQYEALGDGEHALIYYQNAKVCFHPQAVYVPLLEKQMKQLEERTQTGKTVLS